MVLTFIYGLIFILVIGKSKIFVFKDISSKLFIVTFGIKIIFGLILIWIYTKYYPDRKLADIFKYFDDAKVMFSAFKVSTADFFKMSLGIDAESEYFTKTYYEQMNHWYRVDDYGQYNTDRIMIRVNSLIMILSDGNYYVHVLFFNFISFSGLTLMYRAFAPLFEGKEKLLFVCLYFIPSLLLWGSGILKESIVLLALGMSYYFYLEILIRQERIFYGISGVLVSVGLLFLVKSFLLFLIIPSAIIYFLAKRYFNKYSILSYALFYVMLMALSLLIPEKPVAQWAMENIIRKQMDFRLISEGGVFLENERGRVRIAGEDKCKLKLVGANKYKISKGTKIDYLSKSGMERTTLNTLASDTSRFTFLTELQPAKSIINAPSLEPHAISFLKAVPHAFYNGFFIPVKFNRTSLFEIIASMENVLIFIFILLCTLFKRREESCNLTLFALSVAIPLFLIIGYTTPVLGAIVRYKALGLPFILMAFLHVFDVKSFNTKISHFFRFNKT